jgi:hypothetical protein
MKIALTAMILVLISTMAFSQADTLTNSFEAIYKKSNPSLRYKYDPVTQTHNYSGNWDFDQDGKTDEVLFVGTGGAHLYYYLRIVLSKDNVVKNYPAIILDMPLLPGAAELKKPGFNPVRAFAQFAVFDADSDNINEIFIQLDTSTAAANAKQLRKLGITSQMMIISFKDGKIKFNDIPK